MTSDPGPMARFADVKGDALAPEVIFQRLSEGETLREIAKAWGVPKGRLAQWYTVQHAELYDAALKVRAADLALEALEISDGVVRQAVNDAGAPLFDEAGKPVLVQPDASRDRLRAETRLKLASKWDRARYGETVRVEKSVTVGVDAGLLGFAGALLSQVRAPRVLEQGAPPPASLAAPAAPVEEAELVAAGPI